MTIKHLYPTQRPSLDLNFARTKRLDPRVTFTRGSTATYVGNDGLIKYAVDHEPRFDHDPVTGESLGLLVEESRTNAVTVSIPTTTSPWSVSSLTSAITNAATAPDGAYTATLVAADNGNTGNAYVSASFTTIPTNCTVSFFTKDNGVGGCSGLINTTNGQWVFSYNFSTGATSYSGGYVQEIKVVNLPNGWRRVSISISGTSTTFVRLNARTYWGGTHPNGNSSTGVYFWGVQAETGSFPTSYIPTDGTPGGITRAADVASITGSNFSSWYNQSEGSLFSQYIPTAGYGQVDFFGDSLNFWEIGATSVAGGVFGFRTRSTQGSDSNIFNRGRIEDSTNYGYVIKHAAAIADNDFACYTSSSSGDVNLNTGSNIPATGGYLTPLVDRLILTDNLTGVIHLSRLTYYPQRLPDATLQALTL